MRKSAILTLTTVAITALFCFAVVAFTGCGSVDGNPPSVEYTEPVTVETEAPATVASTPTSSDSTPSQPVSNLQQLVVPTATPEPVVENETDICKAYFNHARDSYEDVLDGMAKGFGAPPYRYEWSQVEIVSTSDYFKDSNNIRPHKIPGISKQACFAELKLWPKGDKDAARISPIVVVTALNDNGAERLYVYSTAGSVGDSIIYAAMDFKLPN